MSIDYGVELGLTPAEFIDLMRRSTLAERRPVDDTVTIEGMLRRATVIITARSQGELVGVSRAISDQSYCTYLSDLAVDRDFQRQGIGKKLIDLTHREAGLGTTLVLLAAPDAASYYPHIGMQAHDSCWIIPRQPQERPNLSGTEIQIGVGDFFDSLVQDYDQAIARCFPRYSEMLWALIDYLPRCEARAPRILELGCGTGNLSVQLAKRFPTARMTFVDVSESSLKTCRRRLEHQIIGDWQCVDMREAEFACSSFDTILSSIAIHHLSGQEKRALFANCLRWLQPGGTLSYSDQFSGATQGIYERHMENWKKLSLEAGSTAAEWELWMDHQQRHDHHDSLPDQMDWLAAAGFEQIDCPWRYLLWTVVQAQRPS